jgi:hypothetical protein
MDDRTRRLSRSVWLGLAALLIAGSGRAKDAPPCAARQGLDVATAAARA